MLALTYLEEHLALPVDEAALPRGLEGADEALSRRMGVRANELAPRPPQRPLHLGGRAAAVRSHRARPPARRGAMRAYL